MEYTFPVLLQTILDPGQLSHYSDWKTGFDPWQGQSILLGCTSRLAVGPTQPPIQWILGVLSPGVKQSRGVTLTTHPHLVLRSRTSRSCTSFTPQAPSQLVPGTSLLCFCFYNKFWRSVHVLIFNTNRLCFPECYTMNNL
jgi:hypothetical protein